MSKIILSFLLLTMMGQTAFAQGILSNEQCLKVYRDSAVGLYETAKDFNDGLISRGEMVAYTTAITTTTNAHRAACAIFEDPSRQDCVPDYKQIYSNQRERIHLRAIMMGNQERVSLMFDLKPRIAYLDFICGLR